MEPNPLPKVSSQEVSPQDALHDVVTMIVSGYLKNNLDKNNNPTSKHFTQGLKSSIESGIQIKNQNSKDAKVNAFLKYINKQDKSAHSDLSNDEQHTRSGETKTPLRGLTHAIAEDFAIDVTDAKKVEYLAEALFQSVIDILIKRGQGGDLESQGLDQWDNLDEEQKEKYYHNVKQKRDEQIRSIERWIKYVSSNEVIYPAWYKYFIITSLRSMGVEQFDLGTYTYGGRDAKTLFRFPTLNPAVLAKVYDRMLAAFTEENIKKPIPTKYEIQDTAKSNIDEAEKLFVEKYAKEANFTQLYAYELSKYKEATLESKRSNEGVWIKYNQQEEGSQALKEEAQRLSNSLIDKGTAWCTEGTSFSESQLAGGDFYVYYSREDFKEETHGTPLEDMTEEERKKVCTMPRIAIKMEDGMINELRGIVGGLDQALEPEMIDIARAKYQGDKEKGEEPLPGVDVYEKMALDMKKLTLLTEKDNKGGIFSQDDLLFLYEVDDSIEGFGHEPDPRIEKLRNKRNRQEDIQILCNCPPDAIAHDFLAITESTQVFCEDKDNKLTFFDFREEKNQAKLPQFIELAKSIKASGSPERLDMSFEGGIVSFEIDKKTEESLATWKGAKEAYEQADNNSPYRVWDGLDDIEKQYTKLTVSSLDVIVFKHGETTSTQRNKLVEDMDKAGYRTLDFSELVALGIIKPELNKRNGYTTTLKEYRLDGTSRAPYLDWDGVERRLFAIDVRGDWRDRGRFVFVRK